MEKRERARETSEWNIQKTEAKQYISGLLNSNKISLQRLITLRTTKKKGAFLFFLSEIRKKKFCRWVCGKKSTENNDKCWRWNYFLCHIKPLWYLKLLFSILV